MNSTNKWLLTDEEKDKFIATLTPNLTILRTSAEISQEELANLIGVSRQTYSAIERKVRKMAWSTYLSLVLFYDHNRKTHKLIRQLSIFPKELVIRFNDGVDYSDFEISSFLGNKSEEIIEHLDDQAKGAIGFNNSTSTGYSSGSSWASAVTRGTSETKGETVTETDTDTTGDSRTITVTSENKSVKYILEKIDQHLARIKNCEAFGLWDIACYFVSENVQTSVVAASTYKALFVIAMIVLCAYQGGS